MVARMIDVFLAVALATCMINSCLVNTVNGADTFGTDFAFVFPHMFTDSDLRKLEVAVTNQASGPVDVVISVPLTGLTQTMTIAVGMSVVEELVTTVQLPETKDTVQAGRGVFVSSTGGDVSVAGHYDGDGDSFIVLPTSVLGTTYVAVSYAPKFFSYGPVLAIMAVETGNTVFTVTSGGTTTPPITLAQNEAYQFFGESGRRDAGLPAVEDFTGALISADKKIYVVAGHQCAQVPHGTAGCDSLVENVPPMSSAGTSFVLAPILNVAPPNYVYRVIGPSTGSATVSFSDGSSQETVAAGAFYQGEASTILTITSDVPVLVSQYKTGWGAENPDVGDPLMVIIPPMNLHARETYFHIPSFWADLGFASSTTNSLSIVTQCASSSTISLDGVPVDSTGQLTDGTFCVVRTDITPGTHVISNSVTCATLLVTVYGSIFVNTPLHPYGRVDESFGFVAAYNLAPDTVHPTITNTPSDMTVCADSGATTATVTWTPPTVTDDVAIDLVTGVTSTFDPGDSFTFGTYTVTYDATDCEGNASSDEFDITVIACTPCTGYALTTTGSTSEGELVWVPTTQPRLPFRVVSGGSVGLNLYPGPALTNPSYPYITIELGIEADDSVGDDAWITYQQSASSAPLPPAHSTGIDAPATLTEYWIYIDENEISVGYKDEEAFISLNRGSSNPWNAQSIRYIEVYGWDGTGNTASSWCFPELDSLASLASNRDIDTSSCMNCFDDLVDDKFDTCRTTSSASPFWIRIDLEMVYSITGISLYHAESANVGAGNIENEVVYVGSCLSSMEEDINDNIQCGSRVLASEVADVVSDDVAVYRACPQGTQGRYVYLLNDPVIDLCEIKVHGQEVPESEKPHIGFQTIADVLEEISEGISSTFSLSLIRSGSEISLTCLDVDVCDTITGTASSGADYSVFPQTTVTFGAGQTIVTVPQSVTTIPDLIVENDPHETIIFEVKDTSDSVIIDDPLTTVSIIDNDSVYWFSVADVSLEENVGSVELSLLRNNPSEAATVRASTNGAGSDPATSTGPNPDFDGLTSYPFIFASGESEKTFTITIHDDSGIVDYVDERFSVSLDDLPQVQAVVTILNDDVLYGISVHGYSGVESSTSIDNIQINRMGDLTNRGIIGIRSNQVANEAIESKDYPPLDIIVEIPPNTPFASVHIPIADDQEVEPDEIFNLMLYLPASNTDLYPVIDDGSGNAGVPSVTLTILDDDSQFSVTSLTNTIYESSPSVTVSFSRSGHTAEAVLDHQATIDVIIYTGDHQDSPDYFATGGVDFMKNGTRSVVVFESGSLVAHITIPIIQDAQVENDEDFFVEIVQADGEILEGRRITTVTIKNDDAYFTVQNVNPVVNEAVGKFYVVLLRGSFMGIEGYLETDSSIVAVSYANVSSSPATADEDFEPISEKISFRGDSQEWVKLLPVKITNDNRVESEESFLINFIGSSNLAPESTTITVSVIDDDGMFSIHADATNAMVTEGTPYIDFNVTRMGFTINGQDAALIRPAYVVVTTIGLNAHEDIDFRQQSSELFFPSGVDEVTGRIYIIDDDILEEDESFSIQLVATDGGEVDENNREIIVTISDDDVDLFGFESTDYSVGESCSHLEVVVERSEFGGHAVLEISARDGLVGNGATYPSDYTPSETSIQFLPNQRRQTATFEIVSDSLDEGREVFAFHLTITDGSGKVDPLRREASVTIENQPVRFFFRDTLIQVIESDQVFTGEVVLQGDRCNTSGTLETFISTESITAVASSDFISFADNRLAFEQTQTTVLFTVKLINDALVEDDEVLLVKIDDASADDQILSIQIQDDDCEFRFESDRYVSSREENVEVTIIRAGNAITDAVARVSTATNRGNATGGEDYTTLRNFHVHFEPLETLRTFTVEILEDEAEEGDEVFFVEIKSVTHGTVSLLKEAMVVIEGDLVQSAASTGFSQMSIIGIIAGIFAVIVAMVISGCVMVTRIGQRANTRPEPRVRRTSQELTLFNPIQGRSPPIYLPESTEEIPNAYDFY